ncbi:MAG: EVE domain-containing protein [Candidatus Marinimicrobia bacterium]|nr:EVE domain-containing protein [Candidatus Neomarinimicrobiota bacterium]
MKYWFVRSPFKTRKWEDILMADIFKLYGIRGNAAKKNISEMKKHDVAFWYSSTAGKKVYGIMKVKNNAYPDNTTDSDWLAIDFTPITTFNKPIHLKEIKKNQFLSDSNMVKQSKISVISISKTESDEIIEMAKKK